MADMEEDSDEAQEWGQSPPVPRVYLQANQVKDAQ